MFYRWKKPSDGEAVEPYSRLAEIYDYVMRHVDYEQWADYIQAIFSRFDATPRTILELACGTGSLTEILGNRGYRITGVDRSHAMIEQARRKTERFGDRVRVLQGDMAAPPVEGRFDAALCLYDSINYLLDLETVRRMISHVRACLIRGGLFVFDACTEMNSRRFFHRHTDRESTDRFAYIRRSEYRARERIQVNEFQMLLRRGDRYDLHFERHEQRIYPIGQITDACLDAGFEVAGAFDGFSFHPATEQSNRVHFVLRKPDDEARGT